MDLAGYKAANTASVNIMDVFSRASGQSNAASTLNVNKTPMAKVSGVNHVANLPNVNINLKVDTQNAAPDLAGKQATAMTMREQVAGAAGNFAKDVQNVQATMDVALKEASQTLGIDLKQAQTSMHPAPVTTYAVAAAAVGLSVVAPGMDMALGLAQALSDVKSERGHLTPKQEAALADEMHALLTPKHDEAGNIVAPPVIPSDFDFAAISPEEIKELFKAPEDHPEGQEIWGRLHVLDNEILPNLANAEEHQFDRTGNKLDVAAQTGDVAALAAITGDNAVAEAIITSDEVAFQSGSLVDISGVKPRDGAEQMFAEQIEGTKTALASNNMEFDPRTLDEKLGMSASIGTAA